MLASKESFLSAERKLLGNVYIVFKCYHKENFLSGERKFHGNFHSMGQIETSKKNVGSVTIGNYRESFLSAGRRLQRIDIMSGEEIHGNVSYPPRGFACPVM
jgi:hypothetical protein